ncbi:MAG TPA: hypothetical protein VNI01_03610 [Elusimicrobiota bacterium]|nr:hypothetical protein [Elusimicrobiota bacterium]
MKGNAMERMGKDPALLGGVAACVALAFGAQFISRGSEERGGRSAEVKWDSVMPTPQKPMPLAPMDSPLPPAEHAPILDTPPDASLDAPQKPAQTASAQAPAGDEGAPHGAGLEDLAKKLSSAVGAPPSSRSGGNSFTNGAQLARPAAAPALTPAEAGKGGAVSLNGNGLSVAAAPRAGAGHGAAPALAAPAGVRGGPASGGAAGVEGAAASLASAGVPGFSAQAARTAGIGETLGATAAAKTAGGAGGMGAGGGGGGGGSGGGASPMSARELNARAQGQLAAARAYRSAVVTPALAAQHDELAGLTTALAQSKAALTQAHQDIVARQSSCRRAPQATRTALAAVASELDQPAVRSATPGLRVEVNALAANYPSVLAAASRSLTCAQAAAAYGGADTLGAELGAISGVRQRALVYTTPAGGSASLLDQKFSDAAGGLGSANAIPGCAPADLSATRDGISTALAAVAADIPEGLPDGGARIQQAGLKDPASTQYESVARLAASINEEFPRYASGNAATRLYNHMTAAREDALGASQKFAAMATQAPTAIELHSAVRDSTQTFAALCASRADFAAMAAAAH